MRALLVAAAAFGLHALAACDGTRGLILGDVPADAAAPFDAPLEASAGAADAGCDVCGTPIVFVGDASTTGLQGGTGGGPNVDLCPGNEVLVGYRGFLTPPSVGIIVLGQLLGECADLGLLGGASVTSLAGTLPERGTSQGAPWAERCPAGQTVVGVVGRSGVAVDQLALVCAPWTSADGGPAMEMGTSDTLAAAGGDGGSPYSAACPSGELARGQSLRSGEWIDAFSLVCATPVLATDAGP